MELTTFHWILIFASLSAAINALGIFAISKKEKWAEKAKTTLMCFAAGVLISTPLMFAFPNAISKNEYAGFAALIGFLFMYISNEIIKRKTHQKTLAFGITAIQGIGIHSFIDGLIYTITFSASILIGFMSGLGLVLHEFAEGVIAFSVLIKAGINKKKATIYALIIASLTTPLGAFIAYPLMSKISNSTLGLLLGFVVGVLIYVSASHLLPKSREHEKTHSPWAFLTGVLLALLIVLTKII